MNEELGHSSNKDMLSLAIANESKRFQEYYLWLEKAMPGSFFEEVSRENVMLIVHNLMGFDLQAYFSTIHLKNAAITMCLDRPDADLRILKDYAFYGIKNYQAYISNMAPPFPGITANLRIAVISFTEASGGNEEIPPLALETKEELEALVRQRHPELSEEEFDQLIVEMDPRFLRTLPIDSLLLALEMFFCAQTRDNCQYEVRYNENWEENGRASMEVVLAWRNTPKHHFIYRIARTIHRHHLVMKRVHSTYIDPYGRESILIMVLDLHGSNGQAAWEAADIVDFLRELVTVKYFPSFDAIETFLVSRGAVSGNMGNFLRSASIFIHQALVHVDANLYTLANIEEALCRHPELTTKLCEAFRLKFDPDFCVYAEYLKLREEFLVDVAKLDTGQEENDIRRRNVLLLGMSFIHHTLKTNFFRLNFTAHSFRLDPRYLNDIPIEGAKKFPEIPYAIFFIKGMHFFGFHIRFKDLARGGVRTVYPMHPERIQYEQNNIFSECYHLAYTQHMKNKDIPEGGAKGIIFLNPSERMESESQILRNELEAAGIAYEEIERKIDIFKREQKNEFLYQAQRSFIESLITIINCDPDGRIRAKYVVDYWKRPEYIYLGPDENMHDEMIMWIANFSKKYGYKPGGAFISSKPLFGINHKEYGVTSLGVNVYVEALLKFLGIDPSEQSFTVKMSGGPDGDVAGNQIYNLYKYYPRTAKLLALVDVSGTIFDPKGLDLEILANLFKEGKPIKYYPPEKLTDGGFLLDLFVKRSPTPLVQQTLCWKKKGEAVVQEWLSGSEMNHIYRNNVHEVVADIFIPAGGRPKTLNEFNYKDFLDSTGKPTAKGIVEGANLYLTSKARRLLEKLGVYIIKDSSANKTGVICSSFEVLIGLALKDEEFLVHKEQLVLEILERLRECALNEANLLLRTQKETSGYLTEISEQISQRINQYTYELLDYLDPLPWESIGFQALLSRCFLNYCLPTLRNQYRERMLEEIPEHHRKAIVASHIAAHLVYQRGLLWQPTILDILPVLLDEV